MNSPDTKNAPADDVQAQPGPTSDPPPAVEPQAGIAADNPRDSLVYWYLCSDYAATRLP